MRFGIIGNTSKPIIREVGLNLLAFLRAKQAPYALARELGNCLNQAGISPKIEPGLMCSETELVNQCDTLIALGGDGTMLTAARLVGDTGIPILGVNLGKLGFLAEVSIEEMRPCLDALLAGNVFIESRMVLQAKGNDGRVYFGLNDIVVDKAASPRVIHLETYVDNEYLVTYSADGIIITTPTGSTAYSLAAGGPIVVPQSSVITINPIAPHTLTARPVIVPESSTIRVVVSSSTTSVHITADGQVEGFYATPTEFLIAKAPYAIKLVKRYGHTYYDLLRAKLMWGRDIRMERK
jgi:NAD+ kinase